MSHFILRSLKQSINLAGFSRVCRHLGIVNVEFCYLDQNTTKSGNWSKYIIHGLLVCDAWDLVTLH